MSDRQTVPAARSMGEMPVSRSLVNCLNSFSPMSSGPAATVAATIRVLRTPGAMAFTSIPVSANSPASVSVKRTRAALEAAYALKNGRGRGPHLLRKHSGSCRNAVRENAEARPAW